MVNTNVVINVAKEFSDTPGARRKELGLNSGEAFFEKYAEKVALAYSENGHLTFDFDGCYGFPSSFFNEAFIRFARKLEIEPKQLWEFITIQSRQHTWLSEEVKMWVSS
jgi:hypothetical protein